MTVTNQENTVVYTGNGATTEFDFSFRVDAQDELHVILYTIATGLEEMLDPSDYSVSGIGDVSGGSVTYNPGGSPITSAYKLILRRVVPLTQDVDITVHDGFSPEVIEEQLDRIVMMIQQVSETVERAATLSAANTVDSLEDLLAATLTLADLETQINALANIAADITAVANNTADVSTVAGVAAEVSTLAAISAAISTLAALDTEIAALAALQTEIETLYTNLAALVSAAALGKPINGSESVKTDDYTILSTDERLTIVANKATAITFTMPPVASVASDFQVRILNIGAGVLTIDADGAETILNDTVLTLEQFGTATLWTDGTTWRADIGGPSIVEVSDAEVVADAAIKSSKLAFSQNEADTVTFPLRSVYHRLRERISVMDPAPANITEADSSEDATPWWQEAIEYAETRSLKAVHVPTHAVSSYYKLGSSTITISKPIHIIGEHPLITVGNQSGGLGSTQYLFHVDGDLFPNYEQFGLKNLSLRPDLGGTRCRGILLDRVAYPILEDVIISSAQIGLVMTGNRGYASHFTRVRINSSTAQGFLVDTFTGGGQHNFHGCAFNGNNVGFSQLSNSGLTGCNFNGCAWEGNAQAFLAQGTIGGMGFYGCYAEKNTPVGGYTLGFVPSGSILQRGIVISGGYWETDAEAYPFLLGGAGTINNFEIFGVESEGYSTALVRANGTVVGGQIRSNYLQNMTQVVSNGPFTRVTIANNENVAGAVTA